MSIICGAMEAIDEVEASIAKQHVLDIRSGTVDLARTRQLTALLMAREKELASAQDNFKWRYGRYMAEKICASMH